jgi:hypothetical protein
MISSAGKIGPPGSNALTVARLTKAFASQMDALAKLRRGGEQPAIVEHVHIRAGGQAIVGSVTHAGDRGASAKTWNNPMQHTTPRKCGAKTRSGRL